MRFWVTAAFTFLFAEITASGTKIANNATLKTNGERIVIVIDAIKTNEAIKRLDEKLSKRLDQLITLLQPSLNPGSAVSTCKEVYDKNLSKGNRAYLLNVGSAKIPIYCHMNRTGLGACRGGGWTLVMKIDGRKRTFHYNSKFWSNKIDFNLTGGKTGLDSHETKLPTYWNTSFNKICLGMKIGQQFKSVVINQQARSLYSLIADGKYRATSLGRNSWKTLIGSQASLQTYCNREGFNAVGDQDNGCAIARIGIIGNQESNCGSPDSRIGFGTGGTHDDSNTCGNEATYSPDNGNKHIKAMGFILVQ